MKAGSFPDGFLEIWWLLSLQLHPNKVNRASEKQQIQEVYNRETEQMSVLCIEMVIEACMTRLIDRWQWDKWQYWRFHRMIQVKLIRWICGGKRVELHMCTLWKRGIVITVCFCAPYAGAYVRTCARVCVWGGLSSVCVMSHKFEFTHFTTRGFLFTDSLYALCARAIHFHPCEQQTHFSKNTMNHIISTAWSSPSLIIFPKIPYLYVHRVHNIACCAVYRPLSDDLQRVHKPLGLQLHGTFQLKVCVTNTAWTIIYQLEGGDTCVWERERIYESELIFCNIFIIMNDKTTDNPLEWLMFR